MSTIFAVYYFSAPGAQALPIQTVKQFASESSSCNDLNNCRTRWNIIWSCLVTIFACVWVAIHPNIPDQDEKRIVVTARRVGIMVMALVAPDAVMGWAIVQWVNACHWANKYQKYEWTTTHGYFALMGGFMLFDDNENPRTLDPNDLEPYLKSGEIDITEKEIQGRSRGDALSKGLVVAQVGWFVMQCIARRIEDLPVTELELVTLAFTTASFVTYGFWWNKPLNVECPQPVKRNRKPTLQSTEEDKGGCVGRVWKNTIYMVPTIIGNAIGNAFRDIVNRARKKGMWHTVLGGAKITLVYVIWKPLEQFPKIMVKGGEIGEAKRVATFYSGPKGGGRRAYIIVFGITALFGAIHCFAWSSGFPSDTERLIWRISSLTVTSVPGVMVLSAVLDIYPMRIMISSSFMKDLDNEVDVLLGFVPDWVAGLKWLIFTTLSPLVATIYTLARVALLVLAFTTLRSLPAEAYQTVRWTTFIPHV